MLLSRMCAGIGLREVVTVGAKMDLIRGLPDRAREFPRLRRAFPSERAGFGICPWSLRGIDNAVRALAIEAHRSRRRDYHVWIFSDHGQERSRNSFASLPGGIEGIVAECSWRWRTNKARRSSIHRPVR